MLPTNHTLNQGRYRVINQIGQDETGAVYETFDENSKAKVFLKEIVFSAKKVVSAAEMEKNRQFFTSKARKFMEFDHESLLKVTDFFSDIDRHYLVTEFAEGTNLDKLLEKENCSFALSNVLSWADQMLFALNYLHTQAKPIFHGNLKPQNLRLKPDGKLKIFPVNISPTSDSNGGAANQSIETAAISYLPLEQIRERLDAASQSVIAKSFDEQSEKILHQPIDARSDLYSLAATVYHLSGGNAPVDALTRSIDILEGKTDPLPPLCEMNPSVPREISDVLMKSLEIKRENRFDSAVIMRQVLRTSVLRAKERQTNAAKKQVAPPSAPKPLAVESKTLETPKPEEKQARVEAVNSSNETVSKEEIEQLKERLRQAEEERLKAERRAAEAEKLLLAQKTSLENQMIPPKAVSFDEMPQISGDAVSVIEDEEEFPDIIGENEDEIFSENTVYPEKPDETFSDGKDNSFAYDSEFNTLFAEPPKESRLMFKIACAALVLALLAISVWGVLNFMNPANANPQTENAVPTVMQTVSSEKSVSENLPKTAPKAETVAEKAPEKTAQTAPQTAESSKKPEKTENAKPADQPTVNQSTAKPKQPSADKTKKPAVASAKTSQSKKKAVTVEDLIN